MLALAVRNRSEKPLTVRRLRTAGPLPLLSRQISPRPLSGPVLQAKCACGGGCPRCQSKLATQAKLAVSQPGDLYEQEADRVAEQILRMPASLEVAEKGDRGECPENDPYPRCAGKKGLIQRRVASEASVHDSVPDEFLSGLGPGHPLDFPARSFFECRFGYDFSQVRVHADAKAAEMARSVNALAYTVGRDVVFGEGQLSPGTHAGDRLIAHELAHVVRGPQRPIIYRKGELPLDIDVPDPEATFAPTYKYPWQNPALRETIYPYRDEELAFFLRTYMEIDLENPSATVTPVTAEELTKERTALEDELTGVNVELKEAQKANDWPRVKELNARAHRLKEDLKYLPKPTMKAGVPKGAEKKWTAYLYSKKDDEGEDLEHDALLSRILDRFDTDPAFKRYPKWLRYMVIHFSGMRYKSAHGSYAPAIDLVKRLKREELTFELSAAPESDIAKLGADAISKLKTELDSITEKPTARRARAIKARLTILEAVEQARKAAFSKRGETAKRAAFEELTRLEDERDKLKAELDSKKITDLDAVATKQKRIEELEPLIAAHETEIGSKSLGPVRKSIDAAEDKRRKAVIEHEIERAEEEFSKLDDMQALSVIKAMQAKGAFPDWVWREIVRTTALKLEADEATDWETVTAEEKEQKKRTDPVTKRWKQIMAGWKKDTTAWREKHASDLSLVVIRAVCNEICEMSLDARGVKPVGGISQKARWYATSGGGTSFSTPTSPSDLKPGASLFFLEWSNTPAKDKVNIVRSDLPVALKSEAGETLSDGFRGAGDWAYHFHSDKTVTRTAPIGTTADPTEEPPKQTQYLNWTHEAMLVEVDAKHERVVTFETGPIGLRTRNLKKVLDQWNVFIGFAPSTKEPANLDEYLKEVQPGR